MSLSTDISREVLSEHFQRGMEGKRLVTALFTTFTFDPGFFEQEVLRVFFDAPLTLAPALRRVQMEDALRDLPVRPAVYYDPRALQTTDHGSARLDFARHPVRMNACFHPKIVCALVEEDDDALAARVKEKKGASIKDTPRRRSLILACLSANLTRAGWWENVECAHVEVIEENGKTTLNENLVGFLRWLGAQSPAAPTASAGLRHTKRFEGEAVGMILEFLDGTSQYLRKPFGEGSPRFFYTDLAPRGKWLHDMLSAEAGADLRGMYLEIISPYFDDADDCVPLRRLIETLQPREVRVFLPRDAEGNALVSQRLHSAVLALGSSGTRVAWGTLPKEVTQNGPALRTVHAKVYRFFSGNPKREIWFTGSVNLTRSAHQSGGNMECGFLVELDLQRKARPQFLLEVDEQKPGPAAQTAKDPLDDVNTALTRFALRFDWVSGVAQAFWEDDPPPGPLTLSVGGVELGVVAVKKANEWQPLPAALSQRVQDHLAATSLFTIADEAGTRVHFLVMEEGMTHKPSELTRLSAADILRYWALLTQDQRNAFLADRLEELLRAAAPDGHELPSIPLPKHEDSLFDRMAGFFHAFHRLERCVVEAVAEKRTSQAVGRLFGKKHDSLGRLLDRMSQEDDPIHDSVDRYVIVLCARQSLDHLKKTLPEAEFWTKHAQDARRLSERLSGMREALRTQLREDLRVKMPEEGRAEKFLGWFEKEFLKRATVEDPA